MSINKKIIDKLKERIGDNQQVMKELTGLLSSVEEGKQPKRIIEKILPKIPKK